MASSPQSRIIVESSLKGPRPMEILDEAVILIRKTPAAILSLYYLGALPFCLGLIYFWFDMTEGAEAAAHLPGEAFMLTGLYVWMKTCQAVFSRQLLTHLEGEDEESWTLSRWMNTALLQTIYAGAFVVVYPLAVCIGLPYGWVSAFFHNTSLIATSTKSTLRSSFKEAAELARLWPKQNHLIIGIQLVATFILFLNLAIFFQIIPALLNMFFGIETVFDENNYAWYNSSFCLDVSIFCFLLLNPVNKAVYVLRSFYGRARLNGADLKSALRRYDLARSNISPARALTLALIFSLVMFGSQARGETAVTAQPATPAPQAKSSASKLDEAIQTTLQKDEFAWRSPRVVTETNDENWATRTLRSVLHFFKKLIEKPLKWLADFMEWLLGGKSKHDSSDTEWKGMSNIPWNLIFILFVTAVVGLLIYWLVRHFRRGIPLTLEPLALSPVRTVDLEGDDVRADDLPEDSWLALAQQMIERGELRLALRAFYLASLSVLAQRELVRLGPAKSNRDYLMELKRRLRGNMSLLEFFRENSHLFEASWYGTHVVTAAIIETMRTNHYQMKTHVAA